MFQKRGLKFAQVLGALAITWCVSTTPGWAQESALEAGVHTGTCAAVGALAAPLAAAGVAAGPMQGNATALPAANSFTSIPMSLEALVSSDHAILVAPQGSDEPQACGVVGGAFTESGALILGLAPVGSDGLNGIVFLSPGTGAMETNVSLFLSGGSLSQRVGTSQVETELSAAAPSEPVATTTVAEQASGVTAEEAAYVRTINPILAQLVESTDRFLILYTNPRVGDDDWSIAIVSEFVIWKQLHQQVSEIVPPPSLANLHSQLVGAFSLYAAAGTDIINGIDQLDPSLIDAADAKFARASDMFLNVRDQYAKLQAKLAP